MAQDYARVEPIAGAVDWSKERGGVNYTPPALRETHLHDLEKFLDSYIDQVANIISRMTYGDMIRLSEAIAAIGLNVTTGDGYAQLLHKWATEHLAKMSPQEPR